MSGYQWLMAERAEGLLAKGLIARSPVAVGVALCALLCVVQPGLACAQAAPVAPVVPSNAASASGPASGFALTSTSSRGSKPVCVDAEVDGVRALSYGCLNAQLAPTAIAGGAASQTAAEALATGPSNRVGTFNYSAESNRFGSNWGRSVTPQRPPPLVVAPVR